MGKEEIALFPQCILLNQKIVFPFVNIYDVVSLFVFLFVNIYEVVSLFADELEEPKIGRWGKGLRWACFEESQVVTALSLSVASSQKNNILYLCHNLSLSQTSPCFYGSAVQVIWKLGKGEIARNYYSFFFPQCFQPFWRTRHHFHQIKSCHMQTVRVWKSLKFVIWERVKIFSLDWDCWLLK